MLGSEVLTFLAGAEIAPAAELHRFRDKKADRTGYCHPGL